MTIAVPSESAPRVTDPTPDSITYRFVNYRVLTCVVFIPLGLGGIAMLVNLVAGGTGPPAVFVFLWLAAYGWGVYWWLFRVAYEDTHLGTRDDDAHMEPSVGVRRGTHGLLEDPGPLGSQLLPRIHGM